MENASKSHSGVLSQIIYSFLIQNIKYKNKSQCGHGIQILMETLPSVPHQQTERRKCTAQSYRKLGSENKQIL